jgi:hypothetical protein
MAVIPASVAVIPASVAHLDPKRVIRELKRADGNVSAAARKLKCPTMDLRRMTRVRPELMAVALEAAEQAMDKAEAAIYEGLCHPDKARRLEAAAYILRKSPAARRRNW